MNTLMKQQEIIIIFRIIVFLLFCLSLPLPSVAEEIFEINAFSMRTKDAAILGGNAEKDSVQAYFKAQKKIVYHILGQIGIKEEDIPKDIKDSINKVHTSNFKAFMAYSEGLDLLDNGKFSEAYAAFERAVSLDPDFGLAGKLKDKIPNTSENFNQIQESSVKETRKEILSTLVSSKKTKVSTKSVQSNIPPGLSGFIQNISEAAAATSSASEQAQEKTRSTNLQKKDLEYQPDPDTVKNIEEQIGNLNQ
jgi:hypothetical protein